MNAISANDPGMSPEEQTRQFWELYKQLDQTEQLILDIGIRAMSTKRLNAESYKAWSDSLFARYHAGEELHLSDLEIPPHPSPGCPE